MSHHRIRLDLAENKLSESHVEVNDGTTCFGVRGSVHVGTLVLSSDL